MSDETYIDVNKDKWVRVMCDFCANCLWDRDGVMVSYDELPVSDDLKKRMVFWQSWHDARNSHDPIPYLDEFAHYGLEIAKEVKRQLPEWTVVYFDEAAAYHDRFGNSEKYEYEIMPDFAVPPEPSA